MNMIMELRNKRNTLWEQTKAFLEENRGENGLVAADAVEQYCLISLGVGMGYPEEAEFPIEWFLKEVDRVEVGMDVIKGVSERGCAVSLM